MMRPTLSSRDRRALRLGAWVMLPVLLVMLGVRPYVRTLGAARGELETQRALLARELGALADAPRDSALALSAMRAASLMSMRLFRSPDAVGASAELASHVRALAGAAGLKIDGSETRSLDGDDPRPAMEIRARGDVLEIVAFLRALEDGSKLTRIEYLMIARPFGREIGDGPAAGDLTLTATVTGLRTPAGSSALPVLVTSPRGER